MNADKFSAGLAGFNISVFIQDSAIAEITGITFPSWGNLPRNSPLPSDSVWMKVGDFGQIEAGDTDVNIGSIKILGKTPGTTNITVYVNQMDDDSGGIITPKIIEARLTVVGPPTADFSANRTEGPAPLTVKFEDNSTGSPNSWDWDVNEDGVKDSDQEEFEYVYNTPGIYNVTLTVVNDEGTDTATKTITVYGIPIADFTPSTTEGDAPLNVQFKDKSKYAISWAWDFDGDGNVDS
ncbi:PKD domain-containing protein, partial [Bacteroides sp.]|uniref:PKD domain-containing protein n=1 Tax=Bacteroides sp. TaxID=29523 RepID=UPI0026248835